MPTSHFISQHKFVITLIIAFVLISLIVTFLVTKFWNYTQDDVFITYTYSRNIAEGHGFVFNNGQFVQGTTTPLYTILMAGAYSLNQDLLHVGNALGGIFIGVLSLMSMLLLRKYISPLAQLALVLILITAPLIYVSLGMETLLYCVILITTFWFWHQEQFTFAFIMAGMLTWTRADGVVLAGTLGLLYLYQENFNIQKSLKKGAIYLLVIAPWFIFAWAYFGEALPNTFSAKQDILQGTLYIEAGINTWESFYNNNPLSFLALILVPFGLWRMWLNSKLRPIPMWTILFILGYTVLNVSFFWYYTPPFVGIILLTVFGGDWLLKQLIQYAPRSQIPLVLLVIIAIGISAKLGIERAQKFNIPPERTTTYQLAGEWIDANTPQDVQVVVVDLGIVGYYADRITLDSYGLVVPEMYFNTPEYAIMKYKPEYVVGTQFYLWTRFIDLHWFNHYYVPIAQISTRNDHLFSPMTIYRLRHQFLPEQAIQGYPVVFECPTYLVEDEILPTQTFLSISNDSGEEVLENQQLYLWHTYPAPASLGEEMLREQLIAPMNLPIGEYTWEVECGTTYMGQTEVISFEQAQNFHEQNAIWDNAIRLNGLTFPYGQDLWSGGTLNVMLQWEILEEFETNYSPVLQLLDINGQIIAESRGADNIYDITYTLTEFETGNTIVESRNLSVPPNLPESTYSLAIGLVDANTDEFVPLESGELLFAPSLVIQSFWPGGDGLP